MVWQLFHMGWPWDAPCEKARLPGWLAWQGWLAGLAGCLVAGLAGLAGWLGRDGWAPGLAWLAGLAGLASWLAWQGLAGWTARMLPHGLTDGFATLSPHLRDRWKVTLLPMRERLILY